MATHENAQAPPSQTRTQLYGVYAEAKEYNRPLLQLDLTFARLMDDIVVPYQSNKPFFVDGAPVTPAQLKRIKILRLTRGFLEARGEFHRALTKSAVTIQKLYGEQYVTRFVHLLRQHSEDVTAQVIKAFDQIIKPRLSDYLPKREELIAAALKFFTEGVKALSS